MVHDKDKKNSVQDPLLLKLLLVGLRTIEVFRIEFYRIYRIYRICRKLFLVIL